MSVSMCHLLKILCDMELSDGLLMSNEPDTEYFKGSVPKSMKNPVSAISM